MKSENKMVAVSFSEHHIFRAFKWLAVTQELKSIHERVSENMRKDQDFLLGLKHEINFLGYCALAITTQDGSRNKFFINCNH